MAARVTGAGAADGRGSSREGNPPARFTAPDGPSSASAGGLAADGTGRGAGRLHLAAYALGVAASGMTFADGLIPRLLGQANMQGLLLTCIGVPEYTSKPGGPPGDPSAVQTVTPRF